MAYLRTFCSCWPRPIAPEDLSSWPGHKEVWTVTKHAGRRVLYVVPG